MEKIEIKLENTNYNIYLGNDALTKISDYIIKDNGKDLKYGSILLLSNDKVGPLYKEKILNNIPEEFRKKIHYYEIKDGEIYKNYETVSSVYDYMLEKRFSRNSLIITLGGGVVCDLGGYIAATYMRGIEFLQIPTSLLAQVDASIGGKVAINHSKAKNLIGAFYQPKAVLVNPDFVNTLDKREFLSGMGEIIKHSIIDNTIDYFEYLEKNYESIASLNYECLFNIIKRSCEIKRDVVQSDEKEIGIRLFLNLGHTYAHAIESLYDFKISHGESVAKGIIFELEMFKENIGNEIAIKRNYLLKRVKKLFENFGIDCSPVHMREKEFLNILYADKKNQKTGVTFIEVEDFGKLKAVSINDEKIIKTNNLIKEEYGNYVNAAIDIGTNSTRLFISEVKLLNNKDKKIIRSLIKNTEITSLGKGVDSDRIISEDAINRTSKCIDRYIELCNQYGVTKIEAFATSAVRDAINKERFLTEIAKKNIGIQCIDGELEAKFSFIGVTSHHPNREIAIIDIGGGSTEFSIGKNNETSFLKSFNVGAVRVTEKFLLNGDNKENFTQENIEKAKKWIEQEFSLLKEYKNYNFELIGVAGTVTTQVSVAEKMKTYDTDRVNGYNLKLEILRENFNLFYSKSLEERRKIQGLEPKRAEYVVAGTLILITLLEILERKNIEVSEIDNLEGATLYF